MLLRTLNPSLFANPGRVRFAGLTMVLTALLSGSLRAQNPTPSPGLWPHLIPCRIQDGANPDLFVMTLGSIETPIADGLFDPVKDQVTLKNGTVKSNYYHDVLGVKFYQPLDKSRFALPPSGWCTWYYYYSRITEIEVIRNAEWIAANLKDYGAQYVQIDDGWQGTGPVGSARNWDAINAQCFPQGMAPVARRIKELGLTPGIWIAPHGQNNDDVVKANTNVFLLKADGSYDTNPRRWEGNYLLDPSTPESWQYLEKLFSKMSEWGYEYFKIDGQPTVAEEYRSKQSQLRQPGDTDLLYRRTLESIRKGIGPDRYLLGCWGIPLEGANIMNGSRTGGDIVLGWGGFQVALRPTLQYYYLHNIVWYSDPDVLIVRSPLTLDQARVWATLQGLTGQALMSSDRLMDLSADRVDVMRRVYPAVDIRPLDLFPTERYKRIWDLKINHLGRRYDVVGVFNFSADKADRVNLNWKDLGLPTDRPVHVFDFWNKEYLGAWSEAMVVDTAPASCRVLTLVPAKNQIQLISSSRHITQGWVDLVGLTANSDGTVFTGASRLIRNDPYELRFVFPRGTNFVVKEAVTTSGNSKDVPVKIFNHQGWAAIQFTSAETREVSWRVEFEPADAYHFQTYDPEGTVFVQRAGLDGVNLGWREQYYLNVGYQVYLDGALQGYTSRAAFPLRGLDPHSNYTAVVKTVWDDGRESPRGTEVKFTLASLIPNEISLTQLEPLQATGRWRGFEVEEMLTGAPLAIAGKSYEKGLSSFANSEIEFDLKGLYDRFSALVGVDAGSVTNATAEFYVVADGKELWHSETLSGSDQPKSVDVGIAGVHKLILRSTAPGGRRTRSQADWIEPKVWKQ
jgi:NPCBM/NEW2 domain/Melibiase/Alpha galactosidase C-terminal beta sandwich domain